VIWGGLHGSYLVVNHGWRQVWRRPIDRWWSRAIARSVTLLAVMIGWVFFRAETFDGAINMLQGMANLPSTFHGHLGPLEAWLGNLGIRFQGGFIGESHYQALGWLLFWVAIVWAWPNTQQWMARFEPALDSHVVPQAQAFGSFWQRVRWQPTWQWAVITAGIGVVAMLNMSTISEFLYFQF
jgi:hypothetical protein